jgi:hypothetical protein
MAASGSQNLPELEKPKTNLLKNDRRSVSRFFENRSVAVSVSVSRRALVAVYISCVEVAASLAQTRLTNVKCLFKKNQLIYSLE